MEELETDVVERLSTEFSASEAEIMGFPDRPEVNFNITHPVATLLVRIIDGSSEDSGNLVSTSEYVRIIITILSVNLRSHTGAYSIIERCKRKMKAFSAGGCIGFDYENFNYIGRDADGFWNYEIVFKSKRIT
jgi:hypothetical protein